MGETICVAVMKLFGDVLSAMIYVVGGIIAANLFVSKNVKTYFNGEYDASHIMNRARNSIYIVVEIGDELWKKHKQDFIRYLDSGVDIYWLIANEKYFVQINNYIDSNVTYCKRNALIKEMLEVQNLDKDGKFSLQTFDGFITSSYIAVDIDMKDVENKWRCSSVIHYMPYCYKIESSVSPIQDIYANKNKDVFKELALSIKKMWHDGTPVKNNIRNNTFSVHCKIRRLSLFSSKQKKKY